MIIINITRDQNHQLSPGYNHHHQTQVLKIVNFAGQPTDGSAMPAPVLVEELQVLWLQLMMIRMMVMPVMVVMVLVIIFKSIMLRF